MGQKILIVDDDVDLLETFKDSLTLRGYDVITAFDGQEAIKQYNENEPCITFMDIKMPVMDGYEAFSKIKNNDANAKVVFVTGHETMEKSFEALQHGLKGVLHKPVQPKIMVDMIKENNC